MWKVAKPKTSCLLFTADQSISLALYPNQRWKVDIDEYGDKVHAVYKLVQVHFDKDTFNEWMEVAE